MTLPYNTISEFKVHVVEHKRDLPPRDGKPAKCILKLGLEAPNGEKGWAEIFCDADPASFPAEGSTIQLVIDPPKQDGWLPTAKRPRSGGGGGRRRDPAETAAIQRQHSQEMAIRALALLGPLPDEFSDSQLRESIEEWTDWFQLDIAKGAP